MTKKACIKALDSIVGKLTKVNFHIEGNALGDSISHVAHIRDGLLKNEYSVRKLTRKPKKP